MFVYVLVLVWMSMGSVDWEYNINYTQQKEAVETVIFQMMTSSIPTYTKMVR